MEAIAAYVVKLVIISLILYSYYYFLLRNKPMHSWNRFFLLLSFVASITIPLITLPAFDNYTGILQMVVPVDIISEGTNITFTVTAGAQHPLQLSQIILYVYVLVSIGFTVSMLLSMLRLLLWAKKAHITKRINSLILHTNAKGTPFSFFKYIFWSDKIDMESAAGLQILKHEMVHVRQWHSADRLFVNLLMLVCWINPIFWLLRKELFLVHEFIADEGSVESQDADDVARMLLAAAFPVQYATLTNHFFTSPIKRRLHMFINQQKTRFGSLVRFSALPLLLIIVMLTFCTKGKNPAHDPLNSIAPMPASETADNIAQPALQDTVKASFVGGDAGWSKYISREIFKQIDSLQEAQQAGTTMVDFVVEEDGSLTNMKITKMEGTLLAKIVFDALAKGPNPHCRKTGFNC